MNASVFDFDGKKTLSEVAHSQKTYCLHPIYYFTQPFLPLLPQVPVKEVGLTRLPSSSHPHLLVDPALLRVRHAQSTFSESVRCHD